MGYRYEVDDTNAVRLWNDDNPHPTGAPFIYQPSQPDSTPWVDRAEAQAWAEAFIAMLLTPAPEETPE